ncbi:unnamed protein product, partial [Candidula unifasciata]
GAKKEELASGDVTVEKRQAASSKRGGRQAAKEAQKSDVSDKKTAASRGRSRGGKEKKKESESEDSEEDDKSEQEEESVPKRGRGKSLSAARKTKVEQDSKAAVTGSARARGKTGRGSRDTRKEKGNVEEDEEEQDEETDDSTAVRGKSVGKRGGARQTSKASKKEENQDQTEEGRPQGRAGRNRKGAKNTDKSVDAENNEEQESEEENQVAVKGQRGAKAAKLIEKDAVDNNTVKSKNSKARGRAAVSSSRGGRQTTANAASTEESEEMETVEETEAAELKGENGKEKEAESASSSTVKSSRGRKGESAEKSSSSKASTKVGVASTSTASGKQAKKLEAEPMETEDQDTSATTETFREKSHDSEKASSEASSASKHKLGDDQEHTLKRARLNEESESVGKAGNCNMSSNADAAGSNSQEIADLQQPAETDTLSQPTTPEDTSYEGPRINPFVATPGVPFIVPLTEAELAKQYTVQQRDRDETSSILVEVGSECASDITGFSARGLDVSDMGSLDSMDVSQIEAASDPSQDAVSAANKSGILQNSTSGTASEDSQSAAVSQLPAAARSDSAQSHPFSGILEVHAETTALDSVSSQDVSDISPAHSQNGTVEVAPSSRSDAENLVYVPSSTAIDSRKLILNPAFPVEDLDPAFCFSVVSYNILADCHLRRYDYSYTKPQFLDQKYRHTLLLKELDYLDGDIVCMQEVSPTYYTQLLQPEMKSRGYDGYFIKRTKDFWDEGEATFVKTSKFEVTSHQSISLADLAFKEVDDSGLSEDISKAAKKYLDRADVILLTELKCKRTGKTVNVCNIHVVYDLKALDVQCIQVACAIKQLVAKAGNDSCPHIICGDFNSEVTSPAYQLAKDGYLSDDHIHKLQSLQNLEITDESSRALVHHMWRAFQHTSSNLKSAYEQTLGKEPPVTSFTKITNATLDYIFYSAASLDVTGVLETLDRPVVDASGGLPSDSIPSDHLSLKTVFRLNDFNYLDLDL